MSKDMDEHIKTVHKVVNVVDCRYGKLCVTSLRYKVDKLESFYAEVRLFASKKEDEKFRRNVQVKNKLEESIYLLNLRNSV